jgi:hypothetical protein
MMPSHQRGTWVENCDLNSNRGVANIYIKNGVGFGIDGCVFEDSLAGVYVDGQDNRNITIVNNHAETCANGLLHYTGSGYRTVLCNNYGDAQITRTNPASQTLYANSNQAMFNGIEEGIGPVSVDIEFGDGTAPKANRRLSWFGTANYLDVIGRVSWRSNNNNNANEPAAEIRAVHQGNVNQNFGALEFGTGDNGLVYRIRLDKSGNFYPLADAAYALGTNGNRWSAVWAASGIIQSADARAKTDIKSSQLGLSFINALRPVSYKYIVGGSFVDTVEVDADDDGCPVHEPRVAPKAGERSHFGLIAQEVKAALPEGVDFGGWVLSEKNNPDSEQALRYDQFIAPLIKAVQELSAEVHALKALIGKS